MPAWWCFDIFVSERSGMPTVRGGNRAAGTRRSRVAFDLKQRPAQAEVQEVPRATTVTDGLGEGFTGASNNGMS